MSTATRFEQTTLRHNRASFLLDAAKHGLSLSSVVNPIHSVLGDIKVYLTLGDSITSNIQIHRWLDFITICFGIFIVLSIIGMYYIDFKKSYLIQKEIKKLEYDHNELQRNHDRLTREKDRIDREKQELEKTQSDYDEEKRKISSDFNKKIESLKKEYEMKFNEFTEQLKQSEIREANLTSELTKTNKQNNELKEEIKGKEDLIKEKEQNLAKIKGRNQQLKADYSALENKNKVLEREIDSAFEQLDRLNARLHEHESIPLGGSALGQKTARVTRDNILAQITELQTHIENLLGRIISLSSAPNPTDPIFDMRTSRAPPGIPHPHGSIGDKSQKDKEEKT